MGRFRSGNSEFREDRPSRRPPRRSSGGFGGGYGGGRPQRRSFDNNDSGSFERRRPEMHEALCDKCGKNCEVPFRPTEGKPVLCSDCFNKSGGSSGSRQRFIPRSNTSSSSGISSEQYKELNNKLDKILGILENIEFEEVDEEDDEESGEEESASSEGESEEEESGSEEESKEETEDEKESA